jgi:hypothetical protein
LHNSDDINSGYSIAQTVDMNISAVLIEGNVTEVYHNSDNIFVKSNTKSSFTKGYTSFYKISLSHDTLKSVVIKELREPIFMNMTKGCISCEIIKLQRDTMSNKWVINN